MYPFSVGDAQTITHLKYFIWRRWRYMMSINTEIIRSERIQSGQNLISVLNMASLLLVSWHLQSTASRGEDPTMSEKIQFTTSPPRIPLSWCDVQLGQYAGASRFALHTGLGSDRANKHVFTVTMSYHYRKTIVNQKDFFKLCNYTIIISHMTLTKTHSVYLKTQL